MFNNEHQVSHWSHAQQLKWMDGAFRARTFKKLINGAVYPQISYYEKPFLFYKNQFLPKYDDDN